MSVRSFEQPMVYPVENPVEVLLRGHSPSEILAKRLHEIEQELAAKATSLPPIKGVVRALRSAKAIMRRPFRVGILGESNAGKSTLANLLLGNAVIPTLQLANTRFPTLIRWAASPTITAVLADGSIAPLVAGKAPSGQMVCASVGLPIGPLRAIEILDFPGFADPWLGYRSVDVVRHRVEAVVWCTFSTQAWKESERAAWARLPPRFRRNALLTVTNKDLLRGEQAEKVAARLGKIAASEFQAITLLSAPKAQRALDGEGRIKDALLWHETGAADLFEALGDLLFRLRDARLQRVKAFANRIAGKALYELELHNRTT